MASEASTSQLYSRTYISNGHLNTQGPGLPAWDSFYNTSAHPSNTLYDSAASLNSRHSEEIDSDSFPSPQFSPSQSVAGTILKHPYPSSALSPRSRAVWQLSQSEPSLVLGSQEDALDDMEDDDEYHLQSQTSKRSGKLNVRRRNTLHLDIPIRKVAHTREVEDEDPILMQGDSSLETEKPDDEERVDEGSEMETRRHILDTVVIVDHDSDSIDEQRGRSSLRGVPSAIWRGEGRVNSLPPPKSPNSKENGQEIDLRPPMHIACFARRGNECLHGAQCPYIQLVPSDPSTRPPPPKLSARLPPISYDEAVHPLSTSPLLASAVPRSINAQMDKIVEPEGRRDDEGVISGIQSIRLESPHPPSSPSPSPSPDPVRSRRQVLPSGANPGWSIRKDETGDWISVRNSVSSALSTVDVPKPTERPPLRGPIDATHSAMRLEEVTSMTRPRPPSFPTSAFSFTQRAERLDSSSLQPHPLLKRFDLLLASRTRDPSSYPRHKVRRGGGGRKSRDGSELESEEEEEAFRRKRRRRSSASSISGKYAVPLIPPYRGKPAGTEEDDASSNAAETTEELDGAHYSEVEEEPQPHVETGSIHTPFLRREEQRSNADFVETRSRPRQLQLSSPPTSPDLSSREIRKRQEETWVASARGPMVAQWKGTSLPQNLAIRARSLVLLWLLLAKRLP
ncbi:hypothetical protein FRB91_001512 [Serendipita sp. 411]|nr:hypothetical protein FRB91_001512 [Serendipita sp. 411]